MHCLECGEKLTLRFCENEGLIPYCVRCQKFKFPPFNSAVSMVVVNRAQDRVLLARHKKQNDFILFAGYIRKGETAERAVVRELREETGCDTVKFRYMSSRYHEPRNVLMFNFIVVAETGEISVNPDEVDEARWFTFEEALESVQKNSTAKVFLTKAIEELRRGKI